MFTFSSGAFRLPTSPAVRGPRTGCARSPMPGCRQLVRALPCGRCRRWRPDTPPRTPANRRRLSGAHAAHDQCAQTKRSGRGASSRGAGAAAGGGACPSQHHDRQVAVNRCRRRHWGYPDRNRTIGMHVYRGGAGLLGGTDGAGDIGLRCDGRAAGHSQAASGSATAAASSSASLVHADAARRAIATTSSVTGPTYGSLAN